MKKQKNLISVLSVAALLHLAGCGLAHNGKTNYPESQKRQRQERRGSLTGSEGIVLFGKGKTTNAGETGGSNVGIGINSYLWRATLDTLSFMPLASTDPFGGVIITDWYEDPDAKGERFKVNVLISDKSLTSTAVKVSVFKQNYHQKMWRDASVSKRVASDLEDKILTRARQLRVEASQ